MLDVTILELPDLVELPPETWIQDNGGTGSRFTLHTRQGRALVILTFYLPQASVEENAAFLTLYADEQINMLKNAGW